MALFRADHGPTAPYCPLLRPGLVCRRGSLNFAGETLSFHLAGLDCTEWQHNAESIREGWLSVRGRERQKHSLDGYATGRQTGWPRSLPFSTADCYGAIVHAHSFGVEFTQRRPLEKVASATLKRVRPGSLRPTSISAFFHFPGGAVDATGAILELSTILWPMAPCSM
jgi:hypothetical protein